MPTFDDLEHSYIHVTDCLHLLWNFSELLKDYEKKSFPRQTLFFTCLQYRSFENTVGKGEMLIMTILSFFPHCFLPVWRTFCHFHQIWKLSAANSFSLEGSKICRLGKGKWWTDYLNSIFHPLAREKICIRPYRKSLHLTNVRKNIEFSCWRMVNILRKKRNKRENAGYS